MDNFVVRDGVQNVRFEGEILAESSSWKEEKPRWVEFILYRTPGRQYILSRIGFSLYYHNDDCYAVTRNRLSAISPDFLEHDAVPCPKCRASRMLPEGVFPETPRYTALVSSEALGVVHSLMQEDNYGLMYLTNVAKRLLTEASKVDIDIKRAYLNRHVD